jgi:phytoene/squalene synthetase
VAGLTLPHGATITKVTLYFKDNSASDMVLYLFCRNLDNIENQMAHVVSEGAETLFRNLSTTTINYPIVDNQSFVITCT